MYIVKFSPYFFFLSFFLSFFLTHSFSSWYRSTRWLTDSLTLTYLSSHSYHVRLTHHHLSPLPPLIITHHHSPPLNTILFLRDIKWIVSPFCYDLTSRKLSPPHCIVWSLNMNSFFFFYICESRMDVGFFFFYFIIVIIICCCCCGYFYPSP